MIFDAKVLEAMKSLVQFIGAQKLPKIVMRWAQFEYF